MARSISNEELKEIIKLSKLTKKVPYTHREIATMVNAKFHQNLSHSKVGTVIKNI